MQPQIIVFVPVFVLCRSKLGSQSLASRTTILINDNSVFQKQPCAINDVCARLHGDGAVGVGNLVLHEFDVVRLQPRNLPSTFTLFLAWTTLTIVQEFVAQRFPL